MVPEAAREVAENDDRFRGKSRDEMDRQLFQDEIFEMQKKMMESAHFVDGDFVFCDRGFADSVAYYRYNGLMVPEELLAWTSRFRTTAFILDSLDKNEYDSLRTESPEQRIEIHNEIIRAYNEFKYPIIYVPKMSVAERANFVIEKVKNL